MKFGIHGELGKGKTIQFAERALRKEHNHITQVRPRRIRYVAADCPACSSIDLGKMDADYAELCWIMEQRERALRQ
jgi:hypothetical protein